MSESSSSNSFAGTVVYASTSKAGPLFSDTKFLVPDFQRDYSWQAQDEVSAFWNDLLAGQSQPPYFLGLIILTEEGEQKAIVDGQQRIVSLCLLANAIRLSALKRDKHLVADSMNTLFLTSIDYKNDTTPFRVNFASQRDNATYEYLITGNPPDGSITNLNSNMIEAQEFLADSLERSLREEDASAQLGRWAYFLTSGITFAVFEHPDRNAAYRVFEVVNTRGKELAPAQLIKSFLVGRMGSGGKESALSRWQELEEPFQRLDAETQFTQFVRSVVTLQRGYVESRDLYRTITEHYDTPSDIDLLLDSLEQHVDPYLKLIDPKRASIGYEARAFSVLETLGLRTIRSAFLAVLTTSNPEDGCKALLRIIVPRIASGTFGTGSIERRFAEAAKKITVEGSWEKAALSLSDIIPKPDQFEDSLRQRPFNKRVLLVLRASTLQNNLLPSLEGSLHLVRPRYVENWPDFSDEDFKQIGSTLGNSILLSQERRPRNSNSLEGALELLMPRTVPYELPEVKNTKTWSSEDVRRLGESIARLSREVWYNEH